MADAKGFLTGGEQTLLMLQYRIIPALAFNTGNNPKTPEKCNS